MFDIYLITNLVNGKKYVGYTSKGYKKRYKSHIKEANENKTNRYICQAIRKYGEENFSVELLEKVETHEDAKKREQYYIKIFNTFVQSKGNWGYNGTKGGDGANGVKYPKEIRLKISERQKGKWVGEKNPNFGKGYLMRGNKHFLYGKQHSDSTKTKIGKANKGKFAGTKNAAAIVCTCYALNCETGEISKFNSFYDMRKSLESIGFNFNRSSVLQVVRGERRSHNGYIFYREDITPKEIFKEIESKYQQNICQPIVLEEWREGTKHPNAKNLNCFAKNIKSKEINKFSTWFDLRKFFNDTLNLKVTYSNMYKAAAGKYKHVRGFELYREDITDKDVWQSINNEYNEQQNLQRLSKAHQVDGSE